MTTTDTYDALCAAIDDGDDTALLALADWLEEQGDRLAQPLRQTQQMRSGRVHGPRDCWHDARTPKDPHMTACWSWHCEPARGVIERWHLPRRILGRLRFPADTGPNHRGYATRSAAFLALAEALLESTHA